MSKKLLVVNILGEPGSGKSTTTAGLFYQLSISGYSVEVVAEVAKDYVWEASPNPSGVGILPPEILKDQLFLFGEQNRRLERLRNKREIAIMECPLLMSVLYQPEKYYSFFEKLVLEVFNSYENINIFITRNHKFDSVGRIQDEKQTQLMKDRILHILRENNIPFIEIKTNENIHQELAKIIQNEIKKRK